MSRVIKSWKINWVGNTPEKTSGAQEYALENRKEGMRVVLSHSVKYGRLWACVNTTQLLDLMKKNRNLFEVLLDEVPKCVYFDVDGASDLLQDCLKQIKADFPVTDDNLYISGSQGEKKGKPFFSYHIVLTNIYFDTIEEQQLLKKWTTEHKDLFDNAVYTKNRNMKIINQSKAGCTRIQKIIKGEDEINHLIVCENVENKIKLETLKNIYSQFETTIETTNSPTEATFNKKIDLCTIPQHDLPIPNNFKFEEATPVEVLAIIPNDIKDNKITYDVWVKVGLWAYHAGVCFEDFWAWTRRFDETHKSLMNTKKVYNQAPRYSLITSKSIEMILKRFYPEITIPTQFKEFKNSLNPIPNKAIQEYRDLQLNDLSTQKKFIVLNTPMGTRKTGVMIDWLKKHQFKRVLMFSARITLSKNVCKRLKDAQIQFTNYKDFNNFDKKNGKMVFTDKLIISPQSLHYIEGAQYDAVIIDECETIFNTFATDCKTQGDYLGINWMVFKNIIKKCNKCLMMDAFTSNLTLDFIKDIDNKESLNGMLENPYYLVNMKKPEKLRTIQKYSSEGILIEKVCRDLKDGKKIFIFHPKKEISDLIEIFKNMGGLKSENILKYNGSSKNKNDLLNVNSVWGDEKIKIVVTNSAITVGVNFDIPDIFDNIYCFYTKYIGGRDFTQALMRIRAPKNNIIHFCELKYPFKSSFKKPPNHPDDKIWDKMSKHLTLEFDCKNNVETLYYFFELAGFEVKQDIYDIQGDMYKKIKQIQKETEAEFSFDKIPTVEDIAEIDKIEQKIHKNMSNELEDMIFSKYIFKKQFCENADIQKMKNIWDKGLFEIVNSFKTIVTNDTHLMNKFYKDNNIKITDIIPNYPKIDFSFKEIQSVFKFHNTATATKQTLAKNMINTFWGCEMVVKTGKQIKNQGKTEWEYKTDERYLDYIKFLEKSCYIQPTQKKLSINWIENL